MRILCFGDSNTWGHKELGIRYDKQTRWTALLDTLLGEQHIVIEDGLCGRTTDSLEEEAESHKGFLQKAIVAAYPFDVIIISLGSGDLREDLKLSAKQIADNLGKIIRVILNYDYEDGKVPSIIIASPPHIKSGIESSKTAYLYGLKENAVAKSKEFAKLYRELANELGVYFFDEAEHAQVSDDDCRHLTAEGHEELAKAFAKFITDNIL